MSPTKLQLFIKQKNMKAVQLSELVEMDNFVNVRVVHSCKIYFNVVNMQVEEYTNMIGIHSQIIPVQFSFLLMYW